MNNPFKYGQGLTSNLLSQITPRDEQEAMLLEALHLAVGYLADGEFYGGELYGPSYQGRKAVEFMVREYYGCLPVPA